MFLEPSSLIDAIAAAPDDAARARLLRNGARGLLVEPTSIADVAAAVLDPAEDDRQKAAAVLLSSALDEARMAAENGAPEGSSLLDALAADLSTRDAAHTFAPVVRLRLAQILRPRGPRAAALRHALR